MIIPDTAFHTPMSNGSSDMDDSVGGGVYAWSKDCRIMITIAAEAAE